MQTWKGFKGFKYALDNKLKAFEKETSVLERTIEQVHQDDSQVKGELFMLRSIAKRYRSSFKALEELFSSDRWGDCEEIARKARSVASDLLKLAENKIVELSKMSQKEKDMPMPLHDRRFCNPRNLVAVPIVL